MVQSPSSILCPRHCHFLLIFLLILSPTQVRYKGKAQGRPNPKSESFSKAVNGEKETLRGRIGSRLPRCERRCSSCEHCKAIQVPIDPQARNGNNNISTLNFDAAYARGVDNSNYKPMSWKCKCGKSIFNP